MFMVPIKVTIFKTDGNAEAAQDLFQISEIVTKQIMRRLKEEHLEKRWQPRGCYALIMKTGPKQPLNRIKLFHKFF